MEDLKYPIGQFVAPEVITKEIITKWTNELESFPNRINNATVNLKDEQLDTPYRPEGWTVRQLINHCSDSHMNALLRFKWALTEDNPTIKTYNEKLFAELADSKNMPIYAALQMLSGIHERLVTLIRSLDETTLNRKVTYPDGSTIFLKEYIGLYAWHGNHHLAHITRLIDRMNW